MGKIVIVREQSHLLFSLFEENRPSLMRMAALPGKESLLGNIYLARVKDVAAGIQSAFLSLPENRTVFLPLAQCRELLLANREPEKAMELRPGDEVVIQVSGEALKTKQPFATTKLSLSGQYCVCCYFGHGLHFSRKLSAERKDALEDAIRSKDIPGRKEYSFTIRTNAGNLEELSPLFDEMRKFIEIFDQLTQTYRYRSCPFCFYRKDAEILGLIRDVTLNRYDEIVTDEPCVFSVLETCIAGKKIRLYQDELLPLKKLYSLETHLKEALAKRVWLACGGYLVIEPTEAMVVIDVNSGKAECRRKKSKDFYLKINLEAARETARQLRLRNYSGMIMVDFINMDSDEDNRILLKELDACLKEDQIRTRLVDMTALGIVEITRKKVNRPLCDFFSK